MSDNTITPPKNPSTLEQVEDLLGMATDVRSFITKISGIVSGIVTVVGWVNVVAGLLKQLGFLDNSNTELNYLKEIKAELDTIHRIVSESAKREVIEDITTQLDSIYTAEKRLADVLGSPNFNVDSRRELRDNLFNNIDPAWNHFSETRLQRTLFDFSEYYNKVDWYNPNAFYAYTTLNSLTDPILIQQTGLQLDSSIEVPKQFCRLQNGDDRWDYRLFLPAIVRTVLVKMSHIKLIESFYRTTGRFREDISEMRDSLLLFAKNMLRCIQVTPLVNDSYYLSWAGWAVGAADTVSGASCINVQWRDGFIIGDDESYVPGYPVGSYNDTHYIANIDDCVARSNELRTNSFLSLLSQTGIPELITLINQLEEQINPPEVSETLSINNKGQLNATLYGIRKKNADVERVFYETSVCDQRSFPAEEYYFQRVLIINSNLQHPLDPNAPIDEYNQWYTIPYNYFIESYDESGNRISRVQIQTGDHTATLDVDTFDWEIDKGLKFHQDVRLTIFKPTGIGRINQMIDQTGKSRDNYSGILESRTFVDFNKLNYGGDIDKPGIASNWKRSTIHLDYKLTEDRKYGKLECHIKNRPAEGCFNNMQFVVEEQPGPKGTVLPPIVTRTPFGMIGIEYYLFSDYFNYKADCAKKMVDLINKMRTTVAVNNVPVPIPWWDPIQYSSVDEYVDLVRKNFPQVMKIIEAENAVEGLKTNRAIE